MPRTNLALLGRTTDPWKRHRNSLIARLSARSLTSYVLFIVVAPCWGFCLPEPIGPGPPEPPLFFLPYQEPSTTVGTASLKAGDTYIGKTVGISGGHLTGEDMAASQVKRDFQDVYLGARDLDLSRTSNPGIKTFGDWLETYGDQLPRDATSTAAVLAG